MTPAAAYLLLALSGCMVVYGVVSLHGYVSLRRRQQRERATRIAALVAFAASFAVKRQGIEA